MTDVSTFEMLLLTVTSWVDRPQREVLAHLIEENRVLRRQLRGRRLRLTDDDRRKRAARASVRSIKEECLSRLIPLGERHHRRAVAEFVAHYPRERNHQGLDNELIEGQPAKRSVGRVRRHQRLGALLNYYARAA